MIYIHDLETGHSLPSVGHGVANIRSVDFSSVTHGSSILVADAKKAMSIRSSLNHYKNRNPDKLVGFCCVSRKDKVSGKRRVFFLDPNLL
jgi:hypothetical protein